MKRNFFERILCLITSFLIVSALLFSLQFSSQSSVFLFLLVFVLVYWQRKRLQDFCQGIKNPRAADAVFLLFGWLGALFLEFTLGLTPFHPNTIVNYLVGVGFYLPYFIFWLILIRRYQFTFLEIFYLAGFGRLVFDFLITHKILASAATTTRVLATLLVIAVQALVTLVLFGTLTSLPALFFADQEKKGHDKPLKQYLIGLMPNFLAAGTLIVWMVILKTIFT